LSLLVGPKLVALEVLDLHHVGIALSILRIAAMNVEIEVIMPETVLASGREAAGMILLHILLGNMICTWI
jgi:hypothetical protein